MTLPKLPLGCLLLLLSVGCAATTRSATRGATQGVVDGTLDSLSERETQRRALALLRDPEVRAASRALFEQALDGTLASLSEPERAARIEAMTVRYIRVISQAATAGIADGIRRDLTPAMASMMRRAMRASLQEALGEPMRRDLGRMTEELTRSATLGAMRGMTEGLRTEVGPAMQAMLRDPHIAGPVSANARTLTREAVLGSNDALKQIQAEQERTGRTSLLGNLARLGDTGARFALAISVLGLLVIAGLLVWVWRLATRSRLAEAASLESAERARLFSEVIHASEDKPWGPELHDILAAEEQRSHPRPHGSRASHPS